MMQNDFKASKKAEKAQFLLVYNQDCETCGNIASPAGHHTNLATARLAEKGSATMGQP